MDSLGIPDLHCYFYSWGVPRNSYLLNSNRFLSILRDSLVNASFPFVRFLEIPKEVLKDNGPFSFVIVP